VSSSDRDRVFLRGSGGTTAVARNIISGNASDGVQILGGSNGNKVEGDFLGPDRTGTVAKPNGGNGVVIGGGASGNTIGGPDATYRNMISGNANNGVVVSDGGTTGNTIP
jgi:hypothetical protein